MSIAVTERELAVLRFVGEQYALPMSVVAELVAQDAARVMQDRIAPASAARIAARMAERLAALGYAGRPRALGRWWLVPTRAGLRAAGLPYRAWDLAAHEWSLKHVQACARLRLYLERCYPDAGWESDRAIRQRWHGSGARVRLADGGLRWADGETATGVELERYVKKPARYHSAVLDVDPAWNAGVWWFTPAGQVELLIRRLREAGGGDVHQVYALPEGVAP